MTTVAVIGNHQHSHCSEVFFATGFRENGCNVVPMQVEDVVRDPDAAMAQLRAVDLVTYTRTHAPGRFLAPNWTDRWYQLENAGVRTIGLHLDRFFDLEREHLVWDRDAQFTMGLVYTADGGNHRRFIEAGVVHSWLVPAIDRAELEHAGRADNTMTHDVIFVGSARYHAAYPQRDDLIRFLHGRYGHRFAHYGHGGGRPVIRGTRLNDLYRSAKVVIGDSCFANEQGSPRSAAYWSDRIPETLGRGGFLIHPWVPGLAQHFETGRHLITHVPGDWEDLDAQIGAYIGQPGVRAGIQEQAIEHVRRTATWTVRMREVLCTVGLCAEEVAA